MAESAVSFAVQKLGNLAVQEAALLRGVGDQIESVKAELTRMQCFLKDADAKARKDDDERVKNWVREIRDVAHQIEGVVDVFMVKIKTRRRRTGFMGSLSRYASIPDELIARHRIGIEIKKIKDRIEDISKSRDMYGIVNLSDGGNVCTASAVDDRLQARRRLAPHFEEEDSDIVGFEGTRQALVEQLLDLSKPRRVVVSIVGMGGIGKTTLARKIYNSSEVKRHFDTFTWTTVSRNYKIDLLLKDLAKKVTGSGKEKLENMEVDEVKEELYKFLKRKRYLIVLDDVWQNETWDLIKEAFPNENNGSRLMLTTRSSDVAKSVNPTLPYHNLQPLNDDESWKLFCKKAFPMTEDVQTSCPAELLGLGKKIAKRCGGLPLALVVLGGLLSRRESTYNVWSEMFQSMDWESTTDEQTCMGILALSYDDLPHHYLKSCFLYLGLFPEDFIISRSQLIMLWIAEGFIPQKHNRTMEETARGYVDELIQRSMIQVAERSVASAGNIKGIRIHDLLRDLCISEARRNGFMSVCSDSTDLATSTSTYRIAVHQDINTELASSVPNLHTVLCFNWTHSYEFYNGLKLLRVIDVSNNSSLESANDALPEEIGILIHLRYLRWRESGIKRLPSSIENLYNLQTLLLPRSFLNQVPNAFWKIRSLRHIEVAGFEQDFISGVKKAAIEFLQSLRYVRAGSWIERDLAKATNLRKLGICGVLPSQEAALTSSLGKLDHLASLYLDGEIIPMKIFTVFPSRHHLRTLALGAQILEFPVINEFPPNLTKFTLWDSSLARDAIEVLEKLPSLVYLRLASNSYRDNLMSCSTGGFPVLKYLTLEGLGDLKDWMVERGAMPKLTHLTVHYCRRLKMLPDGLEHITSLQELQLVGESGKWRSRLHEGDGEDWHKVRHIPSIVIK